MFLVSNSFFAFTQDIDSFKTRLAVSGISLKRENSYISVSSDRTQITALADMRRLYFFANIGKTKISHTDPDYGKISTFPEVENGNNLDSLNNGDLFFYHLQIPSSKAGKEELLRIMRNDLNSYFNLRVTYEKRRLYYWSLSRSRTFRKSAIKSKESSKGQVQNGARGIDAIEGGLIFRDQPLSVLIGLIISNNRLNHFDYPVIDETGIHYNVDMEFKSLVTDKEGVIRAFKENGFRLKLKKRKMKVMVLGNQG